MAARASERRDDRLAEKRRGARLQNPACVCEVQRGGHQLLHSCTRIRCTEYDLGHAHSKRRPQTHQTRLDGADEDCVKPPTNERLAARQNIQFRVRESRSSLDDSASANENYLPVDSQRCADP